MSSTPRCCICCFFSLSLGNEGDTDKHPEKRLKAAYQAFEERMMPQLKAENPSMRHSQLKQLIFKMFQTSPENPKNQQNLALHNDIYYNLIFFVKQLY
ncbi:unnamed protein product [Trichobilharzia regenti]|nr:unnamed protein product [Trichobilharzia regenti]